MKVTVSVFGRFHAFNLAQELHKQSYLHRLITTYPKFAVSSYGIDSGAVRSICQLEYLARAWGKIPYKIKGSTNLQFWFHNNFDKLAQRYISPESNLFVGWASYSLYSLRKAKKYGALILLERGCSHMTCQTQILQEEYARWGMKFNHTHPAVYERELQEYLEADKIVIPSLFAKRTFLKQGVPESKLIHLPYGTSLEEFYPMKKEDKVFRVIHCGGITLRKGVQYLLQAFYELRLPNAELWLVGTVDPEIEPLLVKYQSNSIIFKGHHPQNQIRKLYSQCSVFCLASVEDGFGMVIPQAMACGLPVIHTDNTGGEDIVSYGVEGFPVPIRDVEALKEKILFFYENPDKCLEMGNNALEKARKSLSWDEYGKKTIAAYKSVLSVTK